MPASYVARHRVGIASGVVILAAVGALIAYALAVPGFPAEHADLNDGGVWVTHGGSLGLFGRMNNPIEQLDGVIYPAGSTQSSYDLDVQQDGSAVLAEDLAAGEAYPLDPSGRDAVVTAKIPISSDDTLTMAGGTIALIDAAKGAIRAVSYNANQALGAVGGLVSGRPLAVLGSGAAMTVTQDGTILGVSPTTGILTTIRPSGAGFARPSTTHLGTLDPTLHLTAVGDQAVLLETPGGSGSTTVLLPGGRRSTLPGTGAAVAQAAGPAADAVLVATTTSLLSVPLDGSKPTTVFDNGDGAPAAPVWREGCAYAAWAGAPARYGNTCSTGPEAVSVGDSPGPLVFRANRDQVVLNDRTTGATWNLKNRNPVQEANWEQVVQPKTTPDNKSKNNDNQAEHAKALPPKAVADSLGARPGRTTALYVLDNDSDPAGQTLAIASVTASVPAQQSWLSIAPDGQTVDIAMPAGTTTDVLFTYVVRDTNGASASAQVTVTARPFDTPNNPPTTRVGYKIPTFTVPGGGTVTMPVIDDWRDYKDGDPVVLKAPTPVSTGQLNTTSDGDLVYTAPITAGTQQLSYTVADALGATATGTVIVDVQSVDAKPVSATARPDYARGIVGEPIEVSPLDNDLPGSDPLNPTATMTLAGTVASPAGTQVTTNSATGVVTVVSQRTGSIQLSYQVGYGSAPPATGTIRVDVDPAASSQEPITSPDVAALHGSDPVTVDVLADDSDPAGNLLVVQRAAPSDPSQLRVAVIGGEFLRIAPVAGLLTSPQTVSYTVTDGVTGPVQGQVTVTQLPADQNDTPITFDDYATVRGGDSVAIPVLDNDVDPAGGTLSLVRSVAGRPAGSFAVTPASAGAAYVSGRFVRFVAPVVRSTTTATIDYYAQNASGDAQQVGHAIVTITPPPSATNPNQPPQPTDVEARAIAGQTLSIPIPTSEVDPDGDPVTVVGIGSAPKLGRILGFTANTIIYQAFPTVGNGGTDSFQYEVTDTYGATASGVVRVAVTPPGDPQPPVAVNDSVVVAPGATVQIQPLSNDFVSPGDQVTIDPLAKTNPKLPSGTTLSSPTGPVIVRAPAENGQVETINYTIDDGLHVSSPATITIRSQAGVNLPPVAFDQYAKSASATATQATVDVLHGDYDPDSAGPLTVVSPAATPSGTIHVHLGPSPQVIPYVISDGQGARATASVYVPAAGSGLPHPVMGKQITVASGGSTTIDIADYLVDPAGKPLRTTTANTISASPSAGLSARAGSDATHLVLTGAKGYDGPGAVTFQVTDGASLSTPGAATTYVTVPVQVGAATPVLNCPSGGITLYANGRVNALPLASLCHVWTPVVSAASSLRFHVSWRSAPTGLTLGAQDTSRPTVTASGSVRPGATGVLIVGVVGTKATTQTIAIQVLAPPTLTISPISVLGVKAGQTTTVDISGYVQSPLSDAAIAVVGQPSASGAISTRVSASGSRITLTPASRGSGRVVVSFVVTDARNNPSRYVNAQLVMTVLGPPDAPTALTPGRTVEDGKVALTWTAPNDHGSPITGYTVNYAGGSYSRCGVAPSCTIPDLVDGRTYTFTVTATNAVGTSPASSSATATPDRIPNKVSGFVASNPQDSTLTLTWNSDSGTYSAITKYIIAWSGSDGSGGQQDVDKSATTTSIDGLHNDATYTFTIYAYNQQGPSPAATAGGLRESSGRPDAPPAPTATLEPDTASNDEAVVLSGYGVDPNGPGPVTYTVTRTGGGSTETLPCASDTMPTCTDSDVKYDGTTYTYSVIAANATGGAAHTSPSSPATTVEAAATPDPITINSVTPTGNNGEATISFNAPVSHGSRSTISCSISGSPCGGWSTDYPTSGQSNVTRTITGFSNGTSQTVTLQDCNGSSGSSQTGQSCDSPATSSGVTTYGPIGNPSISVSASGQTVSWSISVDPNGRPATVQVTSTHGYNRTFTTGTGVWTDSDSETVGYSYTDTVTVNVTDSGRAARSTSGQARTQDPPPPEFVVTHNGSCSYDGASGCELVYVQVINHTPNTQATCTATGTNGVKSWGPATLSVGSNGSSAPKNTDYRNYQLFDSNGARFDDGTFAVNTSDQGLTCN